jgi:translation initiation factor 2 beta subunit (eIF-2beta)/eIF-5
MSKPKLINIRGIVAFDDPFYRYRMEEVVIIKRGAKNAFINIVCISASLERDTSAIISFLKKLYGAQFEFKDGVALTTKNDLTKEMLQSAIYQYIEENVLCRTCKNPETNYVKEKKKILLVCKACSAKSEI